MFQLMKDGGKTNAEVQQSGKKHYQGLNLEGREGESWEMIECSVSRLGSFTQRVVNAWKGLPGKVMAAERVDGS